MPVLQTSPGPVTRRYERKVLFDFFHPISSVFYAKIGTLLRQLALAKASEGVYGNPISPPRSVVTAAKKITPKRKKRS